MTQTTLLDLTDGRVLEVTDDPSRVDADALWEFLSTSAYWGTWRVRDDVEEQVAGAWRVVSAHLDGRMVGFARALSDGVALAYLADVYVVADVRGLGVGKALVDLMVEGGPGARFRWMLHTRDAHTLYAVFGFRKPTGDYMERPGQESAGP